MDGFVLTGFMAIHNNRETCFLRVWWQNNGMLRAGTGQNNRMGRYAGSQ
jgi:hypothetical protein